MNNFIAKLKNEIIDFFSDKDDADEPRYDPVHIGAMVVIVIVSLSLLFWLLWSILVFGGGIFVKIGALLQIVFTGKKLSDFGYVGYPYAMGVFEGWITNVIATVLLIVLCFVIWWIFRKTKPQKM